MTQPAPDNELTSSKPSVSTGTACTHRAAASKPDNMSLITIYASYASNLI
jgi:hypothetical protein